MTEPTPIPARVGASRSRVLPTSALLLLPAMLLGQTSTTPAATADEPIELSPFVTTAGSDKGYVATSSLAGSRVNTPLKDIAAQIDVMTPEFLNDIGATNVAEAVEFSTNNGGPTEQNVGPNDSVTTTRNNGRARGFDAITNSQDFYETNLPIDLYNVDRLTIANGPQSILFGLGNAGGAIDTTTKRALLTRDMGEVGFRTDKFGSFRTTGDYNQVIIPRKLAVRVVGLRSDGKSYVDGAFNRQTRVTGTVTWRPTDSTTIRVSGENMGQRASNASNYTAQDYITAWAAAGRPLFDNSTGNGGVNNTATPYLGKNTNALRVLSYGASGAPTIQIFNGTALSRGPHQLPGAGDTRDFSLADNSIYPTSLDPRVAARINRLRGEWLRGAVEHRFTKNLFVELGFNYERVTELAAGPFQDGEALNIYADPNRYLPGGTTKTPVTTPNPNAGKMYIESYPYGAESRNLTKEARLTASYEFNFAEHFSNWAKWLGRHRFAGLLSNRVDEDRSQTSRAMVVGNPSFASTTDLLNNSRFLRSRYYLDPAAGYASAQPFPGYTGGGSSLSPWMGPWTLTDTATGQVTTYTIFDNPAGRSSATSGSRKDIDTYMAAVQSYFFNDHVNIFAGRRIDDFKSYLIDPSALVRRDLVSAGDQKGLYTPLAQTSFDRKATIDDRGTTYMYGAVWHVWRWVSVFASKSDNTALPPGYLDPFNKPLPGIFSDGYDYGFRLSAKDDAISMRVNFYREHQHALIGDSQATRTDSATIESRMRGPDRFSGLTADIPADGYDPVTRGPNAYRSVEDKIGRGIDITLVARLTSNWDVRVAVGKQKTHVYNKSADFAAWVQQRLPAWQKFGGLGWDNVTITDTDNRTVHQFYDQDVARDILVAQMRNDLPRFRQHQWRASLFTNYRFSEGALRGLNVGGGVRWLDRPNNGFKQTVYPDGSLGDDTTQQIFGPSETYFDFLLGYGRHFRAAGHALGWRVQLNIRNLFDHDNLVSMRSAYTGGWLDLGRVEPRTVILSTTFSF